MRDRLTTIWVAPLTFFVHLVGASPQLVGSLVDDVVYLGMGTSLARQGTFAVPILPGAPEVAKYPPAFPALVALLDRLGVDFAGEAGARVLCGLNAALWAVAAQVVVDALLPRLGAGRAERVAVGLLLAINTVTLSLVGTAMSEPLFTLALVSALALAWGAAERPTRAGLVGLGGAVALLGLTRSVGGPLALVGAGLALVARERRVAAAIGAGWLVQAVLVHLQRAGVTAPPAAAMPVLHYFASYDEHTAFYTAPLRGGEVGTFVARLTGVAAANLVTGPRALAALLLPADFVGGAAAGPGGALPALGAVAFATAVASAVRAPRARPLVALLVAYAGIFVFWTWPFAVRFWLPVFPLVTTGLVLALARGGNVGRLLLWPIVGAIVIGNAFVPWYRARALLFGAADAAPSAEDAALEEGVDWLRARVHPDDVLVGEPLAVWMARRLGTRAVELDAMLPSADHLGVTLGLVDPRAEAPRLAAALGPSFAALDGLVPADATVWIATLPDPGGKLAPVLAALTTAGTIEWAGTHGALAVWRVPREGGPAAGATAPTAPAPVDGGVAPPAARTAPAPAPSSDTLPSP